MVSLGIGLEMVSLGIGLEMVSLGIRLENVKCRNWGSYGYVLVIDGSHQ